MLISPRYLSFADGRSAAAHRRNQKFKLAPIKNLLALDADSQETEF